MSVVSRRKFLGAGAAVAATTALPAVAKPRSKPCGDLRDIKHVVVVMQENRSFDHYFGSMKGVRGFGDRATILLPGGKTVWEQPQAPVASAPTQYPWPLSGTSNYSGNVPPTPELGAANYPGTSHSWEDQHGAWYGGLMNGWVFAKGGPTTLGFLTRHDLPYHYALAEAYTIGDAYHCSVLSATGPNRTYLWGGSINASKQHGDFIAYSGGDEMGRFLPWEAYGETLQKAGLSWHVYQCADDYGDNGMEYFATFAVFDPDQGGTPAPGNPFYDHGVANVPTDRRQEMTNADDLAEAIRTDVLNGTLPQVSWVVNNQFFSEHPVTAPSNGAYFLKALLNALNADPEVFNSTLVIINYDENDGQFDHVPPPVPPQGEFDEFVDSGTLRAYGVNAPLPVGFGFRVPLILISPWTRGGWVTSEVSDHTSVLQFLEKWTAALGTPVLCPNISPWRRQVAGDLVNAFDFSSPVYGLPKLPDPGALIPEVEYTPLPGSNVMPKQESGRKPARPLSFQPNVNLVDVSTGATGELVAYLELSNVAPFVKKASHFAVYNNRLASVPSLAAYPGAFPGQYTVGAGEVRVGTGPVGASPGDTSYDISVVGPNRFLRRYVGDTEGAGADVWVEATYYDADQHGHECNSQPKLKLLLRNDAKRSLTFTITFNNYSSRGRQTVRVSAHDRETWVLDACEHSDGWYDLTITVSNDSSWSQRLTGHLETGRASVSG